jgi:hypothetical protein
MALAFGVAHQVVDTFVTHWCSVSKKQCRYPQLLAEVNDIGG